MIVLDVLDELTNVDAERCLLGEWQTLSPRAYSSEWHGERGTGDVAQISGTGDLHVVCIYSCIRKV